MKEFVLTDEIKSKMKEQLNADDYNREIKRQEAEIKRRKIYERDEAVKAELERKAAAKKEMEDKARESEKLARKKRVEAANKIMKDELKERERVKKERDELCERYDELPIDAKLKILNDEDDMQMHFMNMFEEAYIKSKDTYKEEFAIFPSFSYKATPADLEKADVLFHMLFENLANYEEVFIRAMNDGKMPDNRIVADDMIVSNFVVSDVNIEDYVKKNVGKDISQRQLAQFQKLYIMDRISSVFRTMKSAESGDEDDIRFAELSKKIFTDSFKYYSFSAQKDAKGELQIIRPSKEFTEETKYRKYILGEHPENTTKNYNEDELAFQLGYVKKFGASIAREKHLDDSVTVDRIPVGVVRNKHELREYWSAFMHAAGDYNLSTELRGFNKDMAVLCDYDAGDFKRLLQEKPQYKKYFDFVVNGPFTNSKNNKTQKEIYDAIAADKDNLKALEAYFELVHSITLLFKLEYEKQRFEIDGWTAEKEEKIANEYSDALNRYEKNIAEIVEGDTGIIDEYSDISIKAMLLPDADDSIIDTLNIASYEGEALRNGWNPKDIFLFGLINDIFERVNDKPDKKGEEYDKQLKEITDIKNKLRNAKNAIERRTCIEDFDDFLRRYVDDKVVVDAFKSHQLEYDRTVENFDSEYKKEVFADLDKIKDNHEELAEAMIKMEIVALERNEDFHKEIFKEYFDKYIPQNEQESFLKTMYNLRFKYQIERVGKVQKATSAIYKSEELIGFTNDVTISNNIYGQVGRLIGKKDEVASIDALLDAFPKKLDDKVKDELRKSYEDDLKNEHAKMFKSNGEYHGQEYQYLHLGDAIDKDEQDLGITIVEAPGGGFNIRYDKPLIEIKKTVLEKVEAQIDDLNNEYMKLKTDLYKFIEEVRTGNFSHELGVNSSLYNAMVNICNLNDRLTRFEVREGLLRVKERIAEATESVNRIGAAKELDYLNRLSEFADTKLKVFAKENYPDLNQNTSLKDHRKEIEIGKTVTKLANLGGKWEAKPTENIRKKEADKKNDKLDKYYKALSEYKNSSKDEELDKGYSANLFFSPARIKEMCGKSLGALNALDGGDLSGATKEYADFYRALENLSKSIKGLEFDKNDGSNKTEECLVKLKDAAIKYRDSVDNSADAALKKNIAVMVINEYFMVSQYGNITNNLNAFQKWMNTSDEAKNAFDNLPKKAKDAKQKRIDDARKAEELKKQEEDRIKEEERKAAEELQKVKDAINKLLKDADKFLDNLEAAKGGIETSNTNITWAKNNNKPDRLQHFKNTKLTHEQTIKVSTTGFEKCLEDLEKLGCNQDDKNVKERIDKFDEIWKELGKLGYKSDAKKAKKQEVKQAAKNNKQAKNANPANANPVNYDRYMELHTGEHKGKDDAAKIKNFAKVLAAYSLKMSPKPVKFSLDKIHKLADSIKEIYELDRLDKTKLDDILATPQSAIEAGDKIRQKIYGVEPASYNNYLEDMTKLKNSMMDPAKRSDEYKAWAKTVEAAANLITTTANMNDKQKAAAFAQANIDVVEATFKYMKGKKSVRFSDDGKARFDNALDSLAIVSKYAPGTNKRIGKVIDRINYVRTKGDLKKEGAINPETFTNTYGGQNAEAQKEKRQNKNNAKKAAKK